MNERINVRGKNGNIPTIIWGEESNKILIQVHGNMSNKEDKVIKKVAEKAIKNGYQVISFDLPKHGERKEEDYECIPQNSVTDLLSIYEYAKAQTNNISIFACSLGAYFTLLADKEMKINNYYLLSPVVNMENLIIGMMKAFDVSEERLKEEKRIELPIGEVLDWDYLTFVRGNPIILGKESKVDIFYGEKDQIIVRKDIDDFVEKYNGRLIVDKEGEHFYHKTSDLDRVTLWIDSLLKKVEL